MKKGKLVIALHTNLLRFKEGMSVLLQGLLPVLVARLHAVLAGDWDWSGRQALASASASTVVAVAVAAARGGVMGKQMGENWLGSHGLLRYVSSACGTRK